MKDIKTEREFKRENREGKYYLKSAYVECKSSV